MENKKETDLYKDIAIRLLKLRKEKGMSQAELGKALSLSPAAIGNYERGDRIVTLPSIIRYAEYFHTTTDYILGRIKDSRDVKDVLESVDLSNLEVYERIIFKTRNIPKESIGAIETLIGNCISFAFPEREEESQ